LAVRCKRTLVKQPRRSETGAYQATPIPIGQNAPSDGQAAGRARVHRSSSLAVSSSPAVAVLPVPDAAQLANYTSAVSRNNQMDLAGTIEEAAAAGPARNAIPVPARAGDPPTIEHVV